jgi:hypothetical protein
LASQSPYSNLGPEDLERLAKSLKSSFSPQDMKSSGQVKPGWNTFM